MEFTKPGVISQTCFLRRYTSSRLDSKQILTQQHATFQFFGTRIRAMREVNGSTILPEIRPVCSTGGRGFGESGQCFVIGIDSRFTFEYGSLKIRCKQAGKGQHIFFRSQYEIVLRLLSQIRLAFPTEGYVISCFVKYTLQQSTLSILANDSCGMFVVRIPIAGIIGMSACRIRKTQINPRMRTTGNTSRNHILVRMADCLHIESIAIQHEVAGDFTFPHIQCLLNLSNIRSFHSLAQFEAYNAQM